ncbi:DNAb domain protein helicase domain protein [Bacillus sp. OxB-1]|uniref:replicative DNA helicase n=1 Tax=Bacillus sp. (strain OxB-1) TaxID=98228 RepID=UPI0005821AFE|nr:DnaB-like helicase C-terminal domain-containing protein [Bacillus sp. OxB-1]BAQ10763.1 DNAb domain protein helicase domain protein [Bacillus sp. OxB-1]
MIAERAVLGSMLKENYLIDDSGLAVSQFTNPVHKMIFQTMKELSANGKSVDYITLLMSCNPQDVGGANYVQSLTNFAQIDKFDDHLEVMLDVWREREKQNVLHIATQENWSIDRIMSELEALTGNRASDHSSISDLLVSVYDDPYIKKERAEGATTGIDALDNMTNGFQDGELTIVAARPSMGKSDIMLHIAKHAGWKNRLPIIFSLEMSASSLRDRLLASTGSFSRARMRDPYTLLNEPQKAAWPKTVGILAETNIQFFDRSKQTVAEMRMKVRKMIHEYPRLKPVIFIDYLTLIHSEDNSSNMHLQISQITKDLKAMAREFNCPVITLAQLSRAVEQRNDKRPLMSDLRESGSIEEDADVILFLYRNAYYTNDDTDSTMELIVSKNRNGPVGTAVAAYNKYTGEVVGVGTNREGIAL